MSKLLNAKILIGLWLATFLAPVGYGACTYTVSPPMQSRGYGAATNMFTVNAGSGCAWSVSNSVSWISILSGASGTSTGTVTYAVAANPYFVGRTGVVTVAGATFTVEQDAAACNYSISPTLREHGNGAVTNTFSVIVGTGCVWSVSNPVSWITIQSGANGTGSSNVTYKISANIDSIGRTGVVTVAGTSFTVRQDGAPCNFSITPDGRNHGNGGVGQANPIDITATTNCAWTVINTNPWINFIGATSGVGNGSVVYGVLANNVPVRRTGNVLIAEQLFELTQNAAGCQYEISPASRSHGHTGSTGTNRVDTIPANGGCAWVVVNTNDWITLIGNPAGTNTGKTFVYGVAPNPNSWPRDGALTVWGEPFFVYQQPAPCSNGYSIFPSSSEPGPEPETNTVQVTAIGGCPWAVVNTNSWISIISPTSATNSGSVTWKVSLNPNSVGRTGVVMIAEKAFTVRQDAALCTYKLSPTNRTHGYSAATNSISLDTLSICSWSVVNTNPWITILATGGVGDSNITYSVSPNGGLTDRTGVVVIGGQPFTLTQSGLGCAVNLSTTARNHGHGAGTNTIIVNIASTCAWTVSNSNSWITILTNSSGVGTNTVTYMVGANPTILPRTNYLNIEEGVIMISQNGAPCSPSISPSSFSHDAGQESRTVNVTAPIGCNWSVVNTNPWISILSGTSGTGTAGVLYQVSANLGSTWRTGVVTIADEIYTVKQDSMTCNYKLSPTNRAHGYGTTTGFLTMNASNLCPWSVVTPNSWITILSGPNGVGSNVVNYSLENNNLTPFERIGSIVVGGISCVITQSGLPCTYAVTPDTRTHGFGAASNFFTVNATNGCTWGIGNTNPWISLVVANGNGSVPVGYAVTENSSTSNRIGVLTLDGGQTFTVTQLASSCSISLSPTNRSHGYAATTNTVFVDTAFGCGWPVVSLTPWITILSGSTGSGTGTVTYAVASNLTFSARSGSIQIGSEIYVVNQGAFNCNYKLSPATRTHGFGVNSNSATITAGSVCEWTASTTNSWISITSASSGIGNGAFNYMVSPNFGTTSRTGVVMLAEETLVITQLAATNGFAFESVLPGPSGEVILKLNGGPPGIWGIYSSPDLITWTKFANITNTTGRVEFIVPSTGGTNCFYRAALQ